jgi:hypothetical protein
MELPASVVSGHILQAADVDDNLNLKNRQCVLQNYLSRILKIAAALSNHKSRGQPKLCEHT